MTLKEFLERTTYAINLSDKANFITAKIRKFVPNIDSLAKKDIELIEEDDIREIFVAILLATKKYVVWGSEALEEYENEREKLMQTSES